MIILFLASVIFTVIYCDRYFKTLYAFILMVSFSFVSQSIAKLTTGAYPPSFPNWDSTIWSVMVYAGCCIGLCVGYKTLCKKFRPDVLRTKC